MKVPVELSNAFGAPFEELIARFTAERKLLPEESDLRSIRFLSRSVVPHVKKLSQLFNRIESEQGQESGLAPYWKESSNPVNQRLAYFLYFMPSNLYRMASIWAELARLGYRWPEGAPLKGIEFGAGPASASCGIAAGENYAPTGLPKDGNWALIEQDKAVLALGAEWARTYFESLGGARDWGIRTFHRRLELKQGLLPRTAPKFNLWLMSFVLNEFTESPREIARALLEAWERHLDEEGIAILMEPALKAQSRRVLELRRELLAAAAERGDDWLQVLLPCLGHQACGALADPDDWCHEEVSWWRPPYFREIDKMAGLDRKTLPFSYLVLIRSRRLREEILPALAGAGQRQRLVSPSHAEGKELEFFICGEEGKRRARYRPHGPEDPAATLDRGDVLLEPAIRGDVHSSRVEKIKGVK